MNEGQTGTGRGRRPGASSQPVEVNAARFEGLSGDVDPDSGEIFPVGQGAGGSSHADASGGSVAGERTIPSVNRERSIQSRVSGSLALGTILLLGGGFLFWYYDAQYARSREAEQASRKAAAVRAGGEMRVPPLGRIEPHRVAQPGPASHVPPPAAAPVAAPAGGPPAKTPEQLALERQLGAPVLRRAPVPRDAAGASAHALAGEPTVLGMPGAMSDAAPWLGALQGAWAPGVGAARAGVGAGASSGALAANLRPTATPAVAAQALPTRRLLLPKGAFIDCTLETAIDTTYEGMATCIGASDVYGADGKVVLLERGTKYVGEQRGSPRQGQGRIFIVWNEARTPDGVVVQLASPGTDELGRSGLPGFVDTHFWDRFGAAILISVIDGTMQAITARQQSGNSVGSGGGVVLVPQGGRDVATEILRGTVAIAPTVVKNQGERIQILVARDVDFRSVYALRADPSPR